MGLLLHDVVEASSRVAATRKRNEKVANLADLFADLSAGEIPIVVAMLSGEPRQGKIGIGYKVISRIDAAAAGTSTITIAEVDAALSIIKGTDGKGSQAVRRNLLTALLESCTGAEQEFLSRLLIGGIRQGALEGVMTDAVARAAGLPVTAVRRAVMMRPDLGEVAARRRACSTKPAAVATKGSWSSASTRHTRQGGGERLGSR